MTDYKEYKIKIIYRKCNSSLSGDDCDIDHDNTYIEYIDPDSLFVKKYCNDYGEVNSNGLDELTYDYGYGNTAIKATLIIDYKIKDDFLKDNPPPPPPIRISISNTPILSYTERLARNRKQMTCKFGDSCRYHKNGNCRYNHSS